MCYSLFAALFSKTFLSHPPFKYPRSAPDHYYYYLPIGPSGVKKPLKTSSFYAQIIN